MHRLSAGQILLGHCTAHVAASACLSTAEKRKSGERVEGERRGPRKMMIRIGFLKDK